MCLVRISCVLLAFLGSVDNWGVTGAPQTSGSGSSDSIGVAEASNHEQDKRYHQQPPPPQYPGYYPPQNHQPYPTPSPPQNHQPYPTLSPQPIPPLILLDQYDHRYPDGSYEYRYALPDETVRYERGYLIPYLNTRILVVKGYYSYRLPDARYLTVFYSADQFGFRQDSSTFSFHRPQLPRSMSVGADTDGDFRNYEAAETTPINDELN